MTLEQWQDISWFLKNFNIWLSVDYDRFWYYVITELPNKEDIEFANSGLCQDGVLWVKGERVNPNSIFEEYKSSEEAYNAGIKFIKENMI
jgi:hypothetical protein